MGSYVNFPAALAAILQQGFLERELEEGLDSILAYRRAALQETVPSRIGETLTRTRKGRKTPVTTPMTPSSNTGLDNGLTSSTFSIEQYSFTIASYADTVDTNMQQELAGIADQLIANSRNNGVQAAQSMERIARMKLFGAYLGGNTRVRTDLGAGSTTTVHVDDIRGFTTVLVNGVVTPISSSNKLTVNEAAVTSSGVTQSLAVSAATPDGTNHSTTPDGISGLLTFDAATLPVNGDSLVALNAPKILRPFSRATTAQLAGSDMLTMGLVEDALAYLRDNGVPPMTDGTYHCILDNTSMRQLWALFRISKSCSQAGKTPANIATATLSGCWASRSFRPRKPTCSPLASSTTARPTIRPAPRPRRPISRSAFAGRSCWALSALFRATLKASRHGSHARA